MDLAKIYKVFSQKGLDLKGYIKANLSLQGSQNDAVNGNYSKLSNEGTLQLRDIKTYSEYFPQPFVIKEGTFAFKQDKASFNEFIAAYGESDFRMNGYLQNVIDYIFLRGGVLKGNFNVHANYINVNEFMAGSLVSADTSSGTSMGTGVIVVPPQYDLSLKAAATKVLFNDINIGDAKTTIAVKEGKLFLKQTGFDIIGCKALMNAKYASNGPDKAYFDYQVQAKRF